MRPLRDELFGDIGCAPPSLASLLGDTVERGELAQGWTSTTIKLDWVAGYLDPKGEPSLYLKQGAKVQISDANPGGDNADLVTVKIPAGTEVYAWTGATAEGGRGYVSAGPTGAEETVYATRRSIYPPPSSTPALIANATASAKLKTLVKQKESSSSGGAVLGLLAAGAALAIAKGGKGAHRRKRRRR
jgi:hypothetical protein